MAGNFNGLTHVWTHKSCCIFFLPLWWLSYFFNAYLTTFRKNIFITWWLVLILVTPQWTTAQCSHPYTVLSPRTEAGPVMGSAVNMHSYRVEVILCQFQASAFRKPGNLRLGTSGGLRHHIRSMSTFQQRASGRKRRVGRMGGRKRGRKRERWHWGPATPEFQLTPATTKASHR